MRLRPWEEVEIIRWIQNPESIRWIQNKLYCGQLKRKSNPRVELMGAVAMSRVVNETIETLGYEFEYKRFRIDSEDVFK